jgi:transposase
MSLIMEGKVQLIRKKRVYSKEFKEELVGLFEQGKFSVLQLGRLYKVQVGVIYQWIYRYSTLNEKGCRIVEMKQSSTSKLKELEQRVKQLEQMLGQKQIKIEFLEKLIDRAQQEYQIDLKKNSSTPRSAGSAKGRKS